MSYNYQPQYVAPATGNYQAYRPSMQQYTPSTWSQTSQVRPVTSLEEVKAYPIDFDGSVFYFPDNANRRIYTKFINLDGTVAINMYELKEIKADQNPNPAYVTKQEFDEVVNQLKMMFEEQHINVSQEGIAEFAAQQPTYSF